MKQLIFVGRFEASPVATYTAGLLNFDNIRVDFLVDIFMKVMSVHGAA